MKPKSGKELLAQIESYIDECRERSDSAEKKKPVFANVAGFCRFAKMSVEQFLSLGKRFPVDFAAAGAYFEDAALNSGATASLIGMYLREYGFWGAVQTGANEVECEHDLYGDGV